MALGGRILFRRACRAMAVAALATALMASLGPTAASAKRLPRDYTSGENGTGMPSAPIVEPKGTRTRSGTRATTFSFSDVTASDAWAKRAIDYVAGRNDWMRDFAQNPDGTYTFAPGALETRKYFARALVLAFAPDELPDPTIVFSDVDPADAWYRYAAVAVSHGWIRGRTDGAFLPENPVSMAVVHRALVLALGLGPAAKALDHIHSATGQAFTVPRDFGTTVLGMRLFLRYNAPTGSEGNDVDPRTQLTRAQVAYSLFRAKTEASYTVSDLLRQYADVELPKLGPKRYALVQWGIRWAGWPYVWGGEWGLDSPEPSALGGQPRSGFDCSGFAWWLLRANDTNAWKVTPPRPYLGWSLPQRTSASMASMAPVRLTYGELKPGDLVFYDGDGDGTTDHVDTYIGNGYALDSSSTPGGITVMWIGDGWYREHFLFGRRIIR